MPIRARLGKIILPAKFLCGFHAYVRTKHLHVIIGRSQLRNDRHGYAATKFVRTYLKLWFLALNDIVRWLYRQYSLEDE